MSFSVPLATCGQCLLVKNLICNANTKCFCLCSGPTGPYEQRTGQSGFLSFTHQLLIKGVDWLNKSVSMGLGRWLSRYCTSIRTWVQSLKTTVDTGKNTALFPCYPRPGGRRVHKGRQILGAIWLAKWQAADSVRKSAHKQTNKWTRKQTNQWSKGRHLTCTSDFCMGTCVCACVHASIQNHTCINMCLCMCKYHIHEGIFFYFTFQFSLKV